MRPVRKHDEFEYSTLEAVKERLAAKGFREPERPQTELPENMSGLADLSPSEVIELYQLHESHYGYVSYQAALSELMVGEWKNNLKHIVAYVKRETPDVDVELNEAVIEARKRLQVHEQEATLLGVKKSGLHRRMAVASRAVEALKIDYRASARGGRLGSAWD